MIFSILLNLIFLVLGTCTIALVVTYLYFKRKYKYWSVRGVPHAKPVFPFGSFKDIRKEYMGVVLKKLYNESKDKRYYGLWMLHRPTLLINDINLIKQVLATNFKNFHSHGMNYDEKNDPFTANLFAFEGARWKNERKILSPAFSPSNLKMVFPTILKCCRDLVDVLKDFKGEEISVKDISRRFAVDVISISAFGIDTNSLRKEECTMTKMAEKIFKPTWDVAMKTAMTLFIPDLAKFFQIRMVAKEIMDFFVDAIRRSVEYRQKNNIKKKDILQLMIQLKNKGYIDDQENLDKDERDSPSSFLTVEQIACQAYVFLIAGFETTSSSMQFLLYELAKNKNIQSKLRNEIKNALAKHGGIISYDAVCEVEYLGQIIDETFRKYSIASTIFRICTEDFKIPDSDVVIEKGTNILISAFGIQWDERYYPEPEKFDPDRFNEEQKGLRDRFTFLPFGEGPRTCIGQRFALLELRAMVFTLLCEFEVAESENTPAEIEYDPKSIIPNPKQCMKLKLIPLDVQNVIIYE